MKVTVDAGSGWVQVTRRLTLPLRRRFAALPEVLVLGHVSRDAFGTRDRLGGAAAFAARAASLVGARTALVTAAPADFALLAPVRDDRRISLAHRECAYETAFAVDYGGPVRRLRLLQRAPDLRVADIPRRFLRAPVAYVAPVFGECGATVVEALRASWVVVGAQGWLRAVDGDGLVVPAVAPEIERPPVNVRAVVFSELDHPDAEALAAHLAARQIVVALTRGAAGATLFFGGRRHEVAPATAGVEVDPTGAGDVFGVVFALALRRGCGVLNAAHHAAVAAARKVEGMGMGNLRRRDLWPLNALRDVAS